MIGTNGKGLGAILAERLGIIALGSEGHDLRAACIACDSTDGFRIHRETGVSHCYVCKASYSRLELAKKMLSNEGAAWGLLVELGLEQPRTNGCANGSAASADPVEAIARAKRIPVESFKAIGAKASGPDCVAIPGYGPKGERSATLTIWTHGTEKQLKGMLGKGDKAGVYLPHDKSGEVQLPKPGETWHVVEGPKDAAALHSLGLLAAGINGSSLSAKLARLFNGVNLVLVPDRDTAGIEGAGKSAAVLCGVAASIKVAALPSPVVAKAGEDVRDVLRREGGAEQVLQATADAQEWEPPNNDLPEIILGVDEHRVTDEAIDALANHPEIFQRSGALVRIVREMKLPKGVERPPHVPRIEAIPAARLREMLAESARFCRIDAGSQPAPAHPPAYVVSAATARGSWKRIRPLEFVTESPVLKPDGTILQTPGYDRDIAAVYQPNAVFPAIAPEPSQQDAMLARDELLEVVEDFPWESEAHRSAWLAGALTPFARPAFKGPSPLILFDANVPGAGKGLACDCTSTIVSGRDFARLAACEKDAEWSKQILSIGMTGDLFVLIDNITGAFGSPSLDAALTAQSWMGRWLGETRMVTCPLRVTWYATANNIVLKGDMPRRVLQVRLNSGLERPEERRDFKHAKLLEWVQANRPRLVVAALTILRAYCRDGRPKQAIPPWGSYEGWSDLVRGAINWLGMPDPGSTRKELSESADSEANQLRQLIAGWSEVDPSGIGCKVSDVLDALEDRNNESNYRTLRGALSHIFNLKPGMLPGAKNLAMKLHHWKKRVVDGQWLDKTDDGRGTALWFVAPRPEFGAGLRD